MTKYAAGSSSDAWLRSERASSSASPLQRFKQFVAARRVAARARRHYEYGLGIAASGGADAPRRSARLFRRALRALDPAEAARLGQDRPAARDAVRERLQRAGLWSTVSLRSWLSTRRVAAALALVSAVSAVVMFVPSVRDSVFPRDLARGKPWVASSHWGSFPERGVMDDGVTVDPNGRFHTLEELYPSVTIDLGETHVLHAVKAFNRTSCCMERALPLAVELSQDHTHWERVGYRRVMFSSWTASFSARTARYVRLRVDRRSSLHLLRVAVY